MFHVVTGGSGSGKSAYAEEQICMLKKKTNSRHLYYIATPFTEEIALITVRFFWEP